MRVVGGRWSKVHNMFLKIVNVVLHLLFCVLLINYYVMYYNYEPYVHLNFFLC